MIDDDDEGDSGPMPALVDPRLADLHDQLKAAEKAMAQSKAVSKQKDDALEAQMLRMARAVEERRKARDKEKEDSAVASALRAKIERAQSVTVAPETLSSPRSVAMPAPYVVPLPPLHVVEATPKPIHVENVAATDNDDNTPVVEDVVAATGDDDVPVVEDVVADEGSYKEKPLDADGVEAAAGCTEGCVVVEKAAAEGGGAAGVEATGGDAEEEADAMEEDDGTISVVEVGVVEAHDVDSVEVLVEGDCDVVADGACALAIVPSTAGPLHISTGALGEVLAVGAFVEAHYGHGLVGGKTVVRKAKEAWSKGVVKAVNRVSKRRVLYDILYDACGTYETGVLASNVRRRSADGCPGHVSPFASNKGAGLGHELEPSPVVPAPVSPQPLPPYDPLPGGMTGEPSRAKKKPRRAQDGTRLPKLAYRLGPEAPYRLGSVDGVKCVGCKEHDAEPPNLGDAKKPKTDVEAVSPPTRDARVGRWIEVYWAGDKVWYKGYVVGRKIINGAVQLSVTYIDGDLYDEALQDEPFAGDGVPPDDRKPWYWRFAEPGEPPSSKKRSLPVMLRLGDAKKPKTDVEVDAEFTH